MQAPILIINLDRSPERMKRCEAQLATVGLDFERIPAVDGACLSAQDICEVYPEPLAGYWKRLRPAEVACYLSHLRALRRLIELQAPCGLILEDDFDLAPDFAHHFAALMPQAIAHDQIRLEGSARGGRLLRKMGGPLRLVRYPHPLTRALAILWSRAGANRFLEQALPLRRPIDVQFKHWWENDLDIAYTYPPLVRPHDQSSALSTIGDRRTRGPTERLRRLGYNLSFGVRALIEAQGQRILDTRVAEPRRHKPLVIPS